jgi:hypothetical protein
MPGTIRDVAMPKTILSKSHILCYAATVMLLIAIMTACSQPQASAPTPIPPTTAIIQTAVPTVTALSVSATTGASRTLPGDFLGVNGSNTDPGQQTETLDVFKQLGIDHFRYPGGGTANYWDWQLGWIDQELNEDDMIWWMMGLQASPDRFTLEDLAALYAETGVAPVFVLNVITRDLADQLERLHYAESLGLPINKIELGNELYLDIETMVLERYPTVEDYATDANRWAAAIKADFPEAEIAVIGASHPRAPQGRSSGWNKAMFPLLSDDITAVAEHIYTDSALGPRTDTSGNAWAEDIFQKAQYNELQTPEGVEKMLAQPFQAWFNFDRFSRLAEDREIWMTEFNLFDWTGPARGTWANGLFVAGFIHNLLDTDNITLATYHSFGGGPLFPTYFPSADFWDGLIVADPEIEPYALTASGVVLSLFSEAMDGMDTATRLSFDPTPMVTLPLTEPYPALWGWQFSNGDNERLLLVNYSAEPVELNLADLGATNQPFHQQHTAPADYVVASDSLTTESGTTGDTLFLPPHSMTVVGD